MGSVRNTKRIGETCETCQVGEEVMSAEVEL